ncbi:MAG: ATP F0F1 synthase subunit B [Pseudomonadota bacterium]
MDILYNTDFVVLVALIGFFALLGYLGVHKLIGGKLDERAEKIREELAEARRLREEAQEVFASFERKQAEVAGQVDEIVSAAKREAEVAAEQAKADLKLSIERRLKRADEQIGMAEASAVKEVKDKAAQIAVAAAAEVLRAKLTADKANALIDGAIDEAGERLH